MTGSLAFLIKDLEEALSKWKSWLSGNPSALESEHDLREDLECSDLRTALEEKKGDLKKENRTKFHHDLSGYRDMRHAVMSSQYALRLAAWNQMRDHCETARAVCPLERFKEDT